MAERYTWIALAAWLPVLSALGQMAEQPKIDLEAGLINSQPQLDAQGLLQGADLQHLGDFTLTCLLDQAAGDAKEPASVLRLPAEKPRISVQLGADGTIGVTLDKQAAEPTRTKLQSPLSGRHSLVLSIKRDPRQALSGLWIDGVECLSLSVPPGNWDFTKSQMKFETGGAAKLSNLRLYNRAFSRPEVLALLAKDKPAPAPSQESIALIGGTEAVAVAESGWLDALLNLQRSDAPNAAQPLLRDLAWEGDTVFKQSRPLNFGTVEDQLARVQAKRAVILFGRQECLEHGSEDLADFRTALTKLIKQCPPNSVIVGTVPFEKKAAPLPDLSPKNAILAAYDDAMRAVAKENGAVFVDVAKTWNISTDPCTRDGLTLNERGARQLAEVIVAGLGAAAKPAGSDADIAKLHRVAMEKSHLWHRYWRPSNWAFLYGDRTAQPSSRDHMNPNIRWFPQELEQYRHLIEAKENELWKLSQDLGRKLP